MVNIPKYSDVIKKEKEDRRFKKAIGKVVENGIIGVNSILNGKREATTKIGDIGEYELAPRYKRNPSLASCYVDKNLDLNKKFETKLNRYFNIYKKPLKRVRKNAQEKGETEGGKKLGIEKRKETMIAFLNLIHAFGEKLEPTVFEDILKQGASSVNLLTKEIILKYEEFSDDKRMQGILQNAYISSLEKDSNNGKQYYLIDRKKLKKHIEYSFSDEFDGICKTFNKFYFAYGKKDLENLNDFSGEITPENLKIAAKKIDNLFIQIFHLNQNGIAFEHLNPKKLVYSFLERYLDEKSFTEESLKKFRELINRRKEFLNIGKESKKYLNELLKSRKLKLKKGKKIEIQNIGIEEINYKNFSNSGPQQRSNWFLGTLFNIDKNGNIISKETKIPDYRGKNKIIFRDFSSFMQKFYEKYNFTEDEIRTKIEEIIDYIGEKGGEINIKQLYKDKSKSLQILRAWVKYYIIYKDNPNFRYEDYKNYFLKGEGIKDMIIEGIDFENANIQISSHANYNSIGNSISKMFDFNTERSSKGRINTENERFKTTGNKNLFYISELFLPPGNKSVSFNEIIHFQKCRIEQINYLISNEKSIFSNYKFYDENYLKILDENGFISGKKIDKKKLRNLRIALKYSIYISKNLKEIYEKAPEEHKLLTKMNEELNLGLIIADIKNPYRTIQKALTKYNGDFYKNCDIVRAKRTDNTIYSSVESIKEILDKIHKSKYNDEIIQVTIGDNTLNPNELGPKPSGYRDLKIHLKTKSGNSIEVQFLCEEINRYKDKGINIEEEFFPLVKKNNIKVSEKNYKFLEKMALERGIKIPKLFKKLINGENYNFNDNLYTDKKLIKSDFFYEIRRECGNKEFENLFECLESLYYDKVWGEISGELNYFYWNNQ